MRRTEGPIIMTTDNSERGHEHAHGPDCDPAPDHDPGSEHDHEHGHHHAFHDMGGEPRPGFIIQEHDPSEFDKDVDVLVNLLASKEVALVRPDERRRGIEELPREVYFSVPYYQRWLYGVAAILVEKNCLTTDEIAATMDRLRGGES
ncbi:MAG: hypothetical protein CMM76_14410 [Rhodospirillaceae bacterium]|nr:hypothetical protein [Rhodospirillaceae bacterium]